MCQSLQVNVVWDLHPGAAVGQFRLSWLEKRGPPVVEAIRRGFGPG
jgi:hypothetical protein